ncbi:MAG: NAD-dependent epimerase/dehydratase family protein [Spirochaetes bacterium]|nr:NAD-dependent epimerase/dehydratase family protein [Spirochaetota bacterium]
MKKIMIFGSTGMAGHVLTYYLLSIKKYKIINISHKYKLNNESIVLDIGEIKTVKKLILKMKPDIIVNFIGILIKASEQRPDRAIFINSYFPHFLEQFGAEHNIKIIHLSTDCVFSGKIGDYSEMDKKDGEGFYAQSKALGEIINDKDLTFRTSIVGPELKSDGEGLFHWFMNQRGKIRGHSQVYWTGITTLELAKAVDAAIEQDLAGLYHLIPDKKISKYELLLLFKKIWEKNNVYIEKFEELGLDKSLINNRADFNYKVKGYQEMQEELYDWMNQHKELYKQYEGSSKTMVLVTGYNGFIGMNLVETLNKMDNITVLKFGREHKLKDLKSFISQADFLFHLAGVNRPDDENEYEKINTGLTQQIIKYIEEVKNPIPIVFSSSIQAELDNPYGLSKRRAEDLLMEYSKKQKVKTYIYRFPNVFGKWCKPNYNSVVATFCYNISHDLEITISDPNKQMDLIYIDTVIEMFIGSLMEEEKDISKYYQPIKSMHKLTLQELADKIYLVHDMIKRSITPDPADEMIKYIYDTFITYLNGKKKVAVH